MEHDFIENELVILSKQTLDLFLNQDNSADLISVYTFYYYTAKWQKTNQPKATDTYVMKGLKMGSKRFKTAKGFLQTNGLISQVSTQDKSGKITGWYVKLNYIWSNDKVKTLLKEVSPVVPIATSGSQQTNALSANSINALNANIISKVTLNEKGGKTPVKRLQGLYSHLFKHLYGFSPKDYAPQGRVFKDLLGEYTEVQIACLLIVFFSWQGMNNNEPKEKDYLISRTHAITLFKFNINKYIAYVLNVKGLTKEWSNDEELIINVRKSLSQ